ncbi:hypothetical protein [Paracoccus sp. Ld10]|uniref:hypothetical protein n=1 Tax=Paracoccus sp. Ld10 TaxID=649158 RepID=UPI00386FA9B7
MNRFVIAAAASLMTLAALPAAAGAMSMNERPDAGPAISTSMKAERRAGDLFNARELGQRNLAANDMVNVTLLPSAGDGVMRSGRNDG